HFGIAIVSTRTHFWIFTALLIILGFILPQTTQPAAAAAPVEAAHASAPRRKHRVVRRSASNSATLETWGPVAVGVGLMTAVLFTLSYDFITNSARITDIGKILFDSLLPVLQAKQTFGILGLMLITWLVGGTMVYLEEAQ